MGFILKLLIHLHGSVKCVVNTYFGSSIMKGGGLRPELHVCFTKAPITDISLSRTRNLKAFKFFLLLDTALPTTTMTRALNSLI